MHSRINHAQTCANSAELPAKSGHRKWFLPLTEAQIGTSSHTRIIPAFRQSLTWILWSTNQQAACKSMSPWWKSCLADGCRTIETKKDTKRHESECICGMCRRCSRLAWTCGRALLHCWCSVCTHLQMPWNPFFGYAHRSFPRILR